MSAHASPAAGCRPRLVIVVSEDWYFCSHRLPIGIAARDAGYEVLVATRVDRHRAEIEAAGLAVRPLRIARGRLSPLADLRTVVDLVRLYRAERPDVVHHVALKPVLYGSLAGAVAGVRGVVNALAGMGFVFTSSGLKARLLKPFVRRALGWVLRRGDSVALVQNPTDAALVAALGVPRDRVRIVRGSGVDASRFVPAPEPQGPVRFTLVARLLRDKGVGEFVEAARLLRDRGVDARYTVVGGPDPENPASIPEHVLAGWRQRGDIEWTGQLTDVPAVWARSHVAVLPSYREGLPKSLLEAAAAAKPLIATDVPGCREVVQPEVNGLLVPPRDAGALADAMMRLAADAPARARMGSASRALVEAHFTTERIARDTLALYAAVRGAHG